MSIEARGIVKRFAGFQALSGVDLTVPGGKLVALLGPSGSGKTTLLRIIAGLEEADAGTIHFHGEDVSGLTLRDRRVGFVFQHYALFRHMTVAENVSYGLRVRPRATRPARAQITRRVNELLELVQLSRFAGRYPHQLSGGQRQRVALARALAIEPRVLLLDEPFGALDAQVRAELRRWIRTLHDEIHVTSVFVTHDQEEALDVADGVVVMDHGRIEQAGTPEQVFHEPATPFVMEFLGEVNRFEVSVNGGRLECPTFVLPPAPGSTPPPDGAARLYVRPHELDVQSARTNAPGFAARVERVQAAGPVARLELRTRDGQSVLADLAPPALSELRLAAGADVWCAPRVWRVIPTPAGGRRPTR